MLKLIMAMRITLDGFIAGPNNEMGWLGPFDLAMDQYEDNFVTAADTLLLGRVTYESFAGA
jgi:dihydrofolate reductase